MEFISKRDFRSLIDKLLKNFTLYGPVKKHGFPAYAEIREFSEIRLARTPTHLSAKEFIFPPRETLLEFYMERNFVKPVKEARKQALLGLHSCDIHAITLLDRVFNYGIKDENYLLRRKNTVLIGTDCVPDDYCFCSSLGTTTAEEGFDLFLHEIGNGFLARVGSKRGASLLKGLSSRKPQERDLAELKRREDGKIKSFKRRIAAPPSELPLIYAGAGGSPVWDKIGAICYGCGSCNLVCPTCYCFDMRDDISMNLKKAVRYRTWDACTLEDFAKISGGINFRKSRAERLRHRFNRKFRYQTDRFKGLFCVGCGRCSRTCLVKINITDTTNEIIGERLYPKPGEG
jgi:sulfhydrogenase subunit beta (sulfur reductase)